MNTVFIFFTIIGTLIVAAFAGMVGGVLVAAGVAAAVWWRTYAMLAGNANNIFRKQVEMLDKQCQTKQAKKDGKTVKEAFKEVHAKLDAQHSNELRGAFITAWVLAVGTFCKPWVGVALLGGELAYIIWKPAMAPADERVPTV